MIHKSHFLLVFRLALLLLINFFCNQSVYAKSANFYQQNVFYAGLAYLGDYQYIDKSYPFTRKLNGEKDNSQATLDKTLVNLIKQNPPKNFNLHFHLAKLSESQTVVMAVALDKELVSREVFKNQDGYITKIILDITLQILFFDFSSMSLIDNYSLSSAINHTVKGNKENIDDEVYLLAQRLYLGDKSNPGLLKEVNDKISTLTPRAIDRLRYQMTQIKLHDRVKLQLPPSLSSSELEQYLGQQFSKKLSAESSVNVLPFSRGYALANQLPGRFSNGEVFNLKMPSPDYEFNLEVKDLIHKKMDGSSLYGSQMMFKMLEPLSQKIYINDDYRYGVYKLESSNQVVTDNWSAYEDAMESLIDDLVQQLKKPVKSWHTEHARSKESSYEQFKTKMELFNE